MAEVSRNLVAILLVLVILVSAIGTWSLFGARAPVEYTEMPVGAQAGSGYVALNVQEPLEDTSGAAVTLQIAEGSEE